MKDIIDSYKEVQSKDLKDIFYKVTKKTLPMWKEYASSLEDQLKEVTDNINAANEIIRSHEEEE